MLAAFAACLLAMPALQVDNIEYEMVEIVRPRLEKGFSHCVDVNNKNVAVAMAGGTRMTQTGGVGSSRAWMWQADESRPIKGVADFVLVQQIDDDGTLGALVPLFDNGIKRWHPGYFRDGEAYMSPLTVDYIDWMRPYDHNGGLSAVVSIPYSTYVVVPSGTVDRPVTIAGKRQNGGIPGPVTTATATVPKFDTVPVNGMTVFGGIDKGGAWAYPPDIGQQVVFANRRGGKVTKRSTNYHGLSQTV
ncbi:MAG: hypothetical protein JSS65_09975 [Armatimonadetes bacterium]|nr:hypothetical protein [Armatimonadota bacterium]